jgi:Type II CAAX prenyl endopeptidase Rce1-like
MASTSSIRFTDYWRSARTPRYSLSFAFPLLALYEALAFLLSEFEAVGVRNGADVLLKSLFITLGGRTGLAIFGGLLLGAAAALVWRDLRKRGGVRPRYFILMTGEAVAYALIFGFVAGALTTLLLPSLGSSGSTLELGWDFRGQLSLPVQLMISLGAGLYEELLFRVLLVSGLALIGARVFRWSRTAASGFAIVLGALIFSGFHYLGPYGEPLALGSFAFRTVAGLLFSGLYLLRGFGITAWTHALYDIFLAVGW